MIETFTELRALAVEFVAGRVSVGELDEAVARLGEWVDEREPALFDLWGSLELRLAERSNGDLDEAEFHAEVAKLLEGD
jgi:hypothetical protein